MSESSAHSPPEGAPPMAPGVLFQSTSVAGGNNRNSTGSTNSSQASSGFESAKSSSSHHLATSISSGSCSSGVGSSSATVVLPHSSVLPPNASPEGPASASSRLSSAGSSTQCRSSAYFSISDGFDSSIGPGGTLTVHKISKGKCPRVNITEMIARGIPEAEIFTEWLQRLCLSEYLALFLGQGYDLTTLARASPEDLTTLGITKPEDRKRLFHDIQTWRNLQDNWPKNLAFDANLSDWLNAIGLKQYVELFEQQGYLSVGSVEQLEPEDLEDIGVKKLGHIKRICLALKKLRSCRADSADMPLSVCPLLCPPSSSSSVCPLPSIVALPLDIHSTTFVPSSAAEDPFKQPTNKWQQSQMTQQSNSQPTTARNWDKNCQRISFDGISTDGTRIISKWREDNDKYVQLRNFSFERDSLDDQPTPDRGPPRLNLYRTSQIIAQLPREPPPEFDEADERGPTNSHLAEGHRGPPPPPAPAPFAPFEMLPLALPSSSCSVSSSSSFLRLFSSQPTTPRHAPHPTFPQVFMDDDHYYGGRQLRQRHFLNAAEGSFNVLTKERTEQPRGIMETELTNLVSKR